MSSDFAQVDYTDAIEILLASGQTFENPVSWGIDLSSEHERYLAEKHFQAPVVVKNYPKDIKAFYMRMNEDGQNRRGPWTCWRRASVKSSVVLSVKNASTCSINVWKRWV
ncbi:Asparagine--tRNA ligase [Serratia marcescens]|uniref:Asparagine--tRNA ligase n=1 Tax=Serratia marcescens TaxID=615 RepID=A0A380A540_SERMA|nr:Asparagine--tRNA ligase [Serratia marcescens]